MRLAPNATDCPEHAKLRTPVRVRPGHRWKQYRRSQSKRRRYRSQSLRKCNGSQSPSQSPPRSPNLSPPVEVRPCQGAPRLEVQSLITPLGVRPGVAGGSELTSTKPSATVRRAPEVYAGDSRLIAILRTTVPMIHRSTTGNSAAESPRARLRFLLI